MINPMQSRTKTKEECDENIIEYTNRSDSPQCEFSYSGQYGGHKLVIRNSNDLFKQAGNLGDDDECIYQDNSFNKGLLQPSDLNIKSKSNNNLHDLSFQTSMIHKNISILVQSKDLNDIRQYLYTFQTNLQQQYLLLSKQNFDEQERININQNINNSFNCSDKVFINPSCLGVELDNSCVKQSSLQQEQFQIINDDLNESNQIINLENLQSKQIKKEIKAEIIQHHIKEFIDRLKQRISHIRLPTTLSTHNYKLINDCSTSYYYMNLPENKQLSRLIQNILNTFYLRGPIILPYTTFSILWDSIVIFFTIVFLYFYSIFLFYAQMIEDQSNFTKYVVIAVVIFGCDIIINFRKAYYLNDQLVVDSKQIAKRYIQSKFFFDLISFIILIVKLQRQNGSYTYNPNQKISNYIIDFLIFLKIFILSDKIDIIQTKIQLKSSQIHLLKLLKQIFILFLSAHTISQLYLLFKVSIIWNIVSLIEDQYNFQNTWKKKISIQDSSWFEIYFYSLYWAMTSICLGIQLKMRIKLYSPNIILKLNSQNTLNNLFIILKLVGYGDIIPSNSIECLFVAISLIFMSLIFAFLINNVSIILKDIERENKELNSNIQVISKYLNFNSKQLYLFIYYSQINNRFFQTKEVEEDLQNRVIYYLKFLSRQTKNRIRNRDKESCVINMLSNKLKDEIIKNINSKILNKCNIFIKNFSSKMNSELVFALQEIILEPDQIIFKDKDIEEDPSMYFISNGQIEIYQTKFINQKKQKQSFPLQKLNQNQYFGEISFFTGQPRTAYARSITQTSLYKLSRSDFLRILQNYKHDFERYKMMYEQIQFQNNYSVLNIKCYNCNIKNHITINCPLIHKTFDKQFIIHRNNFSYFQHRGLRQNLLLSNNFNAQEKIINILDNPHQKILSQIEVKQNPDSKKMIKIEKISNSRKKYNSRFIINLVEISAQKIKWPSQYFDSSDLKLINELDEQRKLKFSKYFTENLASDNSSANSYFSQTTVEKKIQQSKQKDKEINGKSDNILQKIETVVSKPTDEEIQQEVSAIVISQQNSRKEIPYEQQQLQQQQQQSFSNQTNKSLQQTVESSIQKKMLFAKNTKETLAYIGSKLAFSKTDNNIQQSIYETPNEKELSSLFHSDLHKYLLPHSLASVAVISPSLFTQQEQSPRMKNIKSQLNQQMNIVLFPVDKPLTDIDISQQNLQLYEHFQNQKIIVDNKLAKQAELDKVKTIINKDQTTCQEIALDFESVKIFTRFFPNNNIDKVLKRVKILNEIQFNHKKRNQNKQIKRNDNSNQFSQLQIKTHLVINSDMQKAIIKSNPTTSSYGICTKLNYPHPLNHKAVM